MTILSGAALVAAYVARPSGAVDCALCFHRCHAGRAGADRPARRRGRPFAGTPFSIEMLMTIAAVGAVIIDAGEEAATVVFLFLVGELLEGVAAGKARASIQSLTTPGAEDVRSLETDGDAQEVPAESLAVGSAHPRAPGRPHCRRRHHCFRRERHRRGAGHRRKHAGAQGRRRRWSSPARSTATPRCASGSPPRRADNTIARIVQLVEEAQESKAPTERFIDRFSRYYTPGVVVVAALVAVLPPLARRRRTGANGSTRASPSC